MERWPEWWAWEIELTSHLLKRMVDRGFSELDRREMLEHATSTRPSDVPGRWVVATRWRRKSWEVIVEPDDTICSVVVVTAYEVMPRRKR